MSGIIKHEIKRRLKRRIMPESGLFWFRTNEFKLLIEWPSALAAWIYYRGVYHAETVEYLKENINSKDVCVDVGANVGYLTMIMAKRASLVIAFEPDPKLRRMLQENLRANGIDNVIVRHEAVSDEIGRSRFFLNKEPMYSGLVAHTGLRDIIEVDTITLDCFMSHQEVSLVKIDVEGAENKVLKGMRKVMYDNPDLRLIVEVEPDRRGFDEELYSFIDGWNLRNLDRLNVLCWRD